MIGYNINGIKDNSPKRENHINKIDHIYSIEDVNNVEMIGYNSKDNNPKRESQWYTVNKIL